MTPHPTPFHPPPPPPHSVCGSTPSCQIQFHISDWLYFGRTATMVKDSDQQILHHSNHGDEDGSAGDNLDDSFSFQFRASVHIYAFLCNCRLILHFSLSACCMNVPRVLRSFSDETNPGEELLLFPNCDRIKQRIITSAGKGHGRNSESEFNYKIFDQLLLKPPLRP